MYIFFKKIHGKFDPLWNIYTGLLLASTVTGVRFLWQLEHGVHGFLYIMSLSRWSTWRLQPVVCVSKNMECWCLYEIILYSLWLLLWERTGTCIASHTFIHRESTSNVNGLFLHVVFMCSVQKAQEVQYIWHGITIQSMFLDGCNRSFALRSFKRACCLCKELLHTSSTNASLAYGSWIIIIWLIVIIIVREQADKLLLFFMVCMNSPWLWMNL